MLRKNKLDIAKGLIFLLSQQVYQQRGQLAVIGFHGTKTTVLKAPGKLASFNETWIRSIQGGGSTPLTKGTIRAEQLMLGYKRQYTDLAIDCWLLTDGRFYEIPAAPRGAERYTVIDFEDERIQLARAKQLAEQWQADYLRAVDLLNFESNRLNG